MVMVSRPGSHITRNAGVISGQILLNVAKRMYSRGLLGMTPDFHDMAETNPTDPVLYATSNKVRDKNLTALLGTGRAQRLRTPPAAQPGSIPDVVGLGIREAIVVIEKGGYEIEFEGDGTVVSQTPPGGTSAKPGTKVKLLLEKK